MTVGSFVYSFSVWQSNIQNADAGFRLFPVRPIEGGNAVRYYYRSLVKWDPGNVPRGLNGTKNVMLLNSDSLARTATN